MPYHEWGDEDFDWKALDQAINYVVGFCRRWAFIPVHGKEKYGTMRLEGLWLGFSIVQLIWTGYMFKPQKCPQWLWSLDLKLSYRYPVYHYLINWWFIPYQKWIFNLAHKRAVKKWPHIEKEIMDDYWDPIS